MSISDISKKLKQRARSELRAGRNGFVRESPAFREKVVENFKSKVRLGDYYERRVAAAMLLYFEAWCGDEGVDFLPKKEPAK